jgi:hypothetical protein
MFSTLLPRVQTPNPLSPAYAGAEGVWGERLPPKIGGFRGVVPPG